MSVWQSKIDGPGRTLTVDDLKAAIDRISSAETREAERQATKTRIDGFLALKQAAERAGVLDHTDVIIALAHAAHGSPVSPGLYERVRKLIEAQP